MTRTHPKSLAVTNCNVAWASSRSLAAPLIAAGLLRVGLMVVAYSRTGARIMTQGDTLSYLIPGRSLLVHGIFANAGVPEIDRTPGYPIFAELTGMLFDNVLLTVCVQIALSLISIWVVGSIARRVFLDRRAGTIAAWLLACEPLSIVATARIMPETLFVLLVLLSLERLLRFLSEAKLIHLSQCGLFLVLATFVRPVSYYLVLPQAVAIALWIPRQAGPRWKAPIILLASVLPCFAAWQFRNFVGAGYGGFSSIVEKNLYFYQSAEIRARLDHISLDEEQRELGYPDDSSYLRVHPAQGDWSRVQRLRFMKSEAISVLKQHPLMYLRSHFAGVAVVAFSPGATELLQLTGTYPPVREMPHRLVNEGVRSSIAQVVEEHSGTAFLMALFSVFPLLLYGTAAAGLASNKGSSAGLTILAGTALYFLLISGGAQAVARYRLPAVPELCILAAGGVCFLHDKAKRSRRRSSAEVAVSAG